MLISKKELLQETNISYGQLYRWKREGLIPEEWFIKQPTFTGQETFFPKKKILRRNKKIQELKNQYSLEELARILAPEVSERNFTEQDLRIIEEVDLALIPCFFKSFGKNNFTYVELLVLIALSIFRKRHNLSIDDVEMLSKGIKDAINELKQVDYICLLLKSNGEYFLMLYPENTGVMTDERLKKISEINLNEISSSIKLKYRKSFHLDIEEEENELLFIEGGEEVLT